MSNASRAERQRSDLNVPLASASSSSSSSMMSPTLRRQRAQLLQRRLRQLQYDSVAFTHTSYGRLEPERDRADAALPLRDLLLATDDGDGAASKNADCDTGGASGGGSAFEFGRLNRLGMRVYRRLNIVLEEVSDVSRILVPGADDGEKMPLSSTASARDVLRTYDVVSLQPMNEPTLRSCCELLSSSPSVASSASASPPSSNADCVDVLVLEYATGSRGGHGLPYRLRKEYLAKTLQAGITFELCYGTAVIDTKRRQGFLRALTDFRSSFNSIQRKHTLLNKRRRAQSGKCKVAGRIRSDGFPLLLSSGARQNYTLGTNEGVMPLRSCDDVKSFVRHLAGLDVAASLLEGSHTDDGACSAGGSNKRRKKAHRVVIESPADRVLARARDRALGVITHQCIRSHVSAVKRTGFGSKSEQGRGDDTSDSSETGASSSLVRWLLEPLSKQTAGAEGQNDNDTKLSQVIANEIDADDVGSKEAADNVESVMGNNDSEDDNDVEDGFIAL